MSKSNIKNIFYLPSPEIRTVPRDGGGLYGITTYQHGGSLNIKKNLNLYLAPVPKVRIVQDLQEWRESIREAEHPLIPYRYRMQIMYMDTILDAHIRSCLERRSNMTLMRHFQMVDDDGVVNKEWTKYIQKQWFKTFMRYVLDAKWYGYSLIAMGDIENGDFVNLVMVPRTHISPDRLVVSAIPTTLVGEKFMEIPYKNTHIWVPTPSEHALNACGYGLLYELSSLAIYLKNLLNNNNQFTDIFGMPMRQLKTNKLDDETMANQQSALEEMGGLGYIVTGTDDELIFHDVSKGAGYKAYGDLEKRIEAKVSKIILGHSDAMDSTPGKLGAGQGGLESPSMQALSDIAQGDAEFVETIINDKLFKLLRENGIMVPENLHFEFINDIEEEAEQIFQDDANVKVTKSIYNLAQAGYLVDLDWIEKYTGMKLQKVDNILQQQVDLAKETPTGDGPKKIIKKMPTEASDR
jgi:hypothetical protein